MPMMLPPGQGITVAVNPEQATAPGPAAQPPVAPQPRPIPPRSPFRQEVPPDLVIMPHLEPEEKSQNPT